MTNKPIRILYVITALPYGGAETQMVYLATGLKARGWEVRVVSLLPPSAYARELKATGIQVDSLALRRRVLDPRAPFRLAKIFRRERPHVVHSHMVHANLLARLARPLAKVPVLVCTAHNINEGGRYRELAYRITDFLCNLTTQVSPEGLERYVRIGAVPENKIRYIPNGVDTQRLRPNPEARRRLREEQGLGTDFAWLAVGRFDPQKDYFNMLRAFASVIREKPEAQLLIVGDGPLRLAAEELAQNIGLKDKVRFLGTYRDVPGLMNAADSYVMSSAWEGMPMVLLEAGATGLPIVATDVGGNREVVRNGETGFLVTANDPAALADAMVHLMDLSKRERQRMGKAGRQYIEANYSINRILDIWEALYRDSIRKSRQSHT
jgi:glycosyltransferase involved in cell wall biosynthesis